MAAERRVGRPPHSDGFRGQWKMAALSRDAATPRFMGSFNLQDGTRLGGMNRAPASWSAPALWRFAMGGRNRKAAEDCRTPKPRGQKNRSWGREQAWAPDRRLLPCGELQGAASRSRRKPRVAVRGLPVSRTPPAAPVGGQGNPARSPRQTCRKRFVATPATRTATRKKFTRAPARRTATRKKFSRAPARRTATRKEFSRPPARRTATRKKSGSGRAWAGVPPAEELNCQHFTQPMALANRLRCVTGSNWVATRKAPRSGAGRSAGWPPR